LVVAVEDFMDTIKQVGKEVGKEDRKEDRCGKDFYSDKSWDDERSNMCCPYMMQYGCHYMMQGMHMNPSMMYQQPMMGREDDDQFDDEDMSRRRRPYNPYYPPPYYPYQTPY
jgi:hypothetical protein